MKFIYVILVILFFVCGYSVRAQSSGGDMGRLDSLQRLDLRERFSLTDSVVSELYAIRDRYLESMQTLEGGENRDPAFKQGLARQFKSDARQSMIELLGIVKYNLYKNYVMQQSLLRGENDLSVLAEQ